MYQPLLTNRYLTSRVIPLIAVAAVALCVALVIIVVSVMTGFLEMVKTSGRTLMGDVVVSRANVGVPYYEDLIKRIEETDEAFAATAVVDGFGLLSMPYEGGPETVQFWGIEPEGFARVTGYAETLYWRPVDEEARKDMRADDFRLQQGMEENLPKTEADGLALHYSRSDRPAIVLGMEVSQANKREKDGAYNPGYWWMPQYEVTLMTAPIAGGGTLDPESVIFPVVNEFISGVYLIDKTRVMIPLEVGQRMLHLDEAERVDDEGETVGIDPARATMVLVRAAEGVTPEELRDRIAGIHGVEGVKDVNGVYDEFYNDFAKRTDIVVFPPRRDFGLGIRTWLEQQADFIGPIEKERELMRTLFSLVYLVCAGLVLAIFWAIVYEKTRDIGILRSIGASRLGISWIFIRYGFVVGLGGAVCGVGLGYLVVSNINHIHDAMGDPPMWLSIAFGVGALGSLGVTVWRSMGGMLMPLVVGSLVTVVLAGLGTAIFVLKQQGGILIWNPEVYYFSEVPSQMDVGTAVFTMVGAVVFSLIGAFIPAAKAADTDPVTALRYE